MFLRWIREYKELRYLAYHDSLTGLLNRNWLKKHINDIDKKFVYFIDINGLHEINKEGHTAGDEHIKKCVQSINISNEDILIRYAGDEFILLTDKIDHIKTNELVSVGFSEIKGDIAKAINDADKGMLKSKLIWKTRGVVSVAMIILFSFLAFFKTNLLK